MIYIHKNVGFWEIEIPLPSSYLTGLTKGEYLEGAYVPLNEEQIAFYRANPNTTPLEVWFMKIDIPEEYVPTEEEILEAAKVNVIQKIKEYDNSGEINSFTFEQVVGWIDAPTRSNYKNSVDAAILLDEPSVVFELNNTFFTVDTTSAKKLLAKVQRYADSCSINTRTHLATVQSLTELSAVEQYDYTTGYPEKLILTKETI